MQFVTPTPYYEAIEKLGNRTPIASAMLSSEWSDVPVALREHAEFSAGVENIRFLQRVRDLMGDWITGAREPTESGELALKAGSRAQFIDLMREFALSEGMGPLDPKDAGTLKDITSEKRLGLIWDIKTQQSGDYGYWRQGMQPDVLNEFPAQRFIRVKAVKQEREAHIPFEGQVYLKTDPIWAKVINKDFGVPWGPWGWGCGHDVEDADRDEAESLNLIQPGERPEPDRKNFNENLEASTKGLDPDLIAKLKQDLGQQLIIDLEKETMRWASGVEVQPPKRIIAPVPVSLPRVEKEAPPTPSPVTVPAGPRENKKPVSAAVDVQVRGDLRADVNTAVNAIDSVHDDGTLTPVPLRGIAAEGLNGRLVLQREFGSDKLQPVRIDVSREGPWPALTATHELGHLLDVDAIYQRGKMATRSGFAPMRGVIDIARRTEAVQQLESFMGKAKDYRLRGHYSYLLSAEEIWARAYAQFIAERSADATLAAQLDKALAWTDPNVPGANFKQWSREDFTPLGAAIENMFKEKGWM